MGVVFDENPAIKTGFHHGLHNGDVVEADVAGAQLTETTALRPLIESFFRISHEPVLEVDGDQPVAILLGDLHCIAVCRGQVSRVEDESAAGTAVEKLLEFLLRFDRRAKMVVQPHLNTHCEAISTW